jgi:thiamine-monophosphate kinase
MGEFQLIDWIKQRVGIGGAGVLMGIGDDAAVLDLPPGSELVITTDTLNAGVHFDPESNPTGIGHKALAVNLSDLAAMGATPRWVLLSISLPAMDPPWIEAFVDAFLGLASASGVSLVGGDTCRGPLSVSVTALGTVQRGQALLRGSARPGDLIVVSGSLGSAALALGEIQRGEIPGDNGLSALHQPVPRIALGSSLVGKATSCIDISDGLLADLGHLVTASACGAEIMLEQLPAGSDLQQRDPELRWKLQLSGGDDYELCFSVPAGEEEQLLRLSLALDLELTVIGKMVKGSGIRCLKPDGTEFDMENAGYEHFK